MEASEIIGIFFLASSSFTLVVHGLVIAAVFLERQRAAGNAFYTIYMMGGFVDTLSLLNGVFTYCSFTGFLDVHLITSLLLIYLSQTIVWGARISQMLTVLMMATNRLTAIRYPMSHLSIWSNKMQCFCSFLQIVSLFVCGIAFVACLRPTITPSSYGGVVASFLELESRHAVYLGATILQSANGLIVLVLYIVVIHDVRVEVKKVQTVSNHVSYYESSLYKVALIVCLVEILSVLQQVVQNRYIIERETSTIIYIVRTAIYTSIPPYLLIFFSESIRKRVLLFFALRRHQSTTRNVQVLTTETENGT